MIRWSATSGYFPLHCGDGHDPLARVLLASSFENLQDSSQFNRDQTEFFAVAREESPDPASREEPMSDQVDHPTHYGGNTAYEAIKVIEAWNLGFCLGNTVKYIARAERKGTALEDLKKARWYLDREIAKREQDLQNAEKAARHIASIEQDVRLQQLREVQEPGRRKKVLEEMGQCPEVIKGLK